MSWYSAPATRLWAWRILSMQPEGRSRSMNAGVSAASAPSADASPKRLWLRQYRPLPRSNRWEIYRRFFVGFMLFDSPRGNLHLRHPSGLHWQPQKPQYQNVRRPAKFLLSRQIDVNSTIPDTRKIVIVTGSSPRPITSKNILEMASRPNSMIFIGVHAIAMELSHVL
jgi:hypothetical protein